MPFSRQKFGGFPFKRDATGAAGDRDFRSQLDDIAKRHPEFAEHLGKFQHRTPQSAGAADDPDQHRRFERVDPDLHRRFERPFGDRFQHFGFPFDREDFDPEEYAKQFYQQRPQDFYPQPQGSSSSHQQPHAPHSPPQQTYQSQQSYQPPPQQPYPQPYQPSPPKQNQETQTSPTEPVPPTPIYEREKGNIQQSNSTDLGQQQEPVNDRTQRSASEPPSGKGQRYTSSVNIPVNQPQQSNMSSNQSESKERIIPIHIEGRDEPFMPKTVPPTFAQAHPHPQAEPMYNQAHFNRNAFGDGHFPKTEIPIPVQTEHPAKPHHHHQGQQTAHFPKGEIPIPVQREFSPARQQQQPQAHQQTPQPQAAPQQPQQEAPQQQQQEKAKQQPQGPIEQIQCIQKDVSDLMKQVEVFAGKPKDKQYLYLDEMLTRNMLKLDNIETGGLDSIRNARRECIRCIEKAIGVLESKAAANVARPKDENVMDVDETSQEPKENQEAKTNAEAMESESRTGEAQSAKMEAESVEKETNEEPMEKDRSQSEAVSAPTETCEGQENNMAVADAVKKFENKDEDEGEKKEEKTEQKEEKKETKKKGKKKVEKKKE
ncbi:unnamed protein product [Acanthoscelides obtectus]|uniref:BAG domain-containing protein n=1 Tax=Acanthoscelides obtectus TaxID=200917 RepID=A0A9P0M8M8_ACAOB|nr:unnamed protein product [Acanthoscelides obtectus]CAK1670362.1 BAG domain-containing protein Samui [Acanthoscelides obtectus]